MGVETDAPWLTTGECNMPRMKIIALDVHCDFCHGGAIDSLGKELAEFKAPTTISLIRRPGRSPVWRTRHPSRGASSAVRRVAEG